MSTKPPKLTLEDKRSALQELIREKQEQFEAFETAQKQTLESSNKQAGENEDRFENPQEQMVDEIEMRSGVLDKIKTDLELLRGIHAGEELESVERGALVRTDQLLILVATAHPDRMSDREKLVFISTEAPIFEAMRGKKAGEGFTLNGQTHKIHDVV
ncbi:MAG: hypothetical protein ABR572_06330 [Cryomorphaceae bacterium]|nr:hypothetical protein [Flavobacteriales bacterium]